MKMPKELATITPLSKILAAILFITLPFVGFFLGIRYQEMMDLAKRQEMSADLSVPRAPTPTPIAIPTVDPSVTANWKTYRNTKAGYLVKYPTNFFVKEYEFATIFSSEPQPTEGPGLLKFISISIRISTNNAHSDSQNKEFDALFKAKEGDDVPEAHHAIDVKVTKLKNFKIGGYDAVEYIHDGVTIKESGLGGRGFVGYSHIVMVRKNDQIIKLVNTSKNPEETKQVDSIFDQILSTFQFTN